MNMNITNITDITNTNHNSENELMLILYICSPIGACCYFLMNCRRSFSATNNDNNKNTYDFSNDFNDIER